MEQIQSELKFFLMLNLFYCETSNFGPFWLIGRDFYLKSPEIYNGKLNQKRMMRREKSGKKSRSSREERSLSEGI